MSNLHTSIVAALRNAGIQFHGGTWLRLKGKGPNDALSINAESGGWIDHRTGEHGGPRALGDRLGLGTSDIPNYARRVTDTQKDWHRVKQQQAEKDKIEWAKKGWARGIAASCSTRSDGEFQQCRDAIYCYLASRGLDPLPLLPMIKFSTTFKSQNDKEMQAQGADFYFMVPMYVSGAVVADANICGIQRTYLSFSGAKIGRAMLGTKGVTLLSGSSDPVWLPTDHSVLGIGEGFETVASFVQSTGHSGLVCWDWSGLKNWSESMYPSSQSPIIALLVDADTSQTGQRESAAAYRRITSHEHGKAVYLLPPDSIQPDSKGNIDWNDLLRQSNATDFAAEIVTAWHNSDANLALAPIASDAPAPVTVTTGPTDAEVEQAIADAVECHVAAPIVAKEIEALLIALEAYPERLAEWQKLTPEERKAKKFKKPKPPKTLIKITPGVGKSHQIRELIKNTDQPLLILTRSHELATDYVAAGAYPYHGRSEPQVGEAPYTAEFVKENEGNFLASDCYKHKVVRLTSENNHVPALTACRNCEHGRKFIIENYDEKSIPYVAAQAFFAANQIDKSTVPACRWLSHQMEASHRRIVVAPNASFSDSLATWQTPDGPVPRLVIVDEIPDLTRALEIDSNKLGQAVDNMCQFIGRLKIIRSGVFAPEEATDQLISDIEIAMDILGGDIGRWLGESVLQPDTQLVPDDIVNKLKEVDAKWLKEATPRWEEASIRYGQEPIVPLRMTAALVKSISTRTATVNRGVLNVREVTALGEHILAGKTCLLLDATPSRAVVAVIEGKGGKVVSAIAKQHINLVHHHQYLHGRTWKNKDHQKSELASLLTHREQMQAETGNVPNVLTYMPHCHLADQENAPDWGYFGRDDIGQDRWGGQDLLIFGGNIFSPVIQATTYNSELMLMRLAGIEDLPDWSTAIERDQLITVGDKLVPCKAPLPTNPHLRDWVLADYGRRAVQSIGRVRGVWATADKPINVSIVGGLPLAGLAEHGIEVNEYRQSKLVDLRDEAHKTAIQKVQVAVAALQAADQDPSWGQVNQWLADHGLPSVRYNAWKSIVNKASTGLNNNTYEPVEDLLASLHSLQKVADWQGLDISDVALTTWQAPNVDPEIKAAAEIILQTSQNAHKWRETHPG